MVIILLIFDLVLSESRYHKSPFKSAAVNPILKQRPPRAIDADLRLISLTCQISKVLQSFTLSRILPKLLSKLDSKQLAAAGRSTDH